MGTTNRGLTPDDLPPSAGLSRRDFFSLVGATTALAATVACERKGQTTVVPYTKRPVEVIPGVANYYASTFQEGRRIYPVLVKTREGRPIHVTGNDRTRWRQGKDQPARHGRCAAPLRSGSVEGSQVPGPRRQLDRGGVPVGQRVTAGQGRWQERPAADRSRGVAVAQGLDCGPDGGASHAEAPGLGRRGGRCGGRRREGRIRPGGRRSSRGSTRPA